MSPNAPFSFHCIICFEPFHLKDRNPVVLPCGHTFVCLQCSKQLTCCMECRAPLFATPKPCAIPVSHSPSQLSPGQKSLFAGRYSSRTHTPPSPPCAYFPSPSREREHLPIPNNLVLMALMEAAEKTADRPGNYEDLQRGYESGDDDEHVLAGIQLLSSDSGTYVVREKAGLWLHQKQSADEQNKEASSVSFSLNSYGSDDGDDTDGSLDYDNRKREDTMPNKEETVHSHIIKPLRILYSETVQVVSFKRNIAQLSRGRGHLVANSTQLSKVGDFVDKASKVESMRMCVALRRSRLQEQINALEQKMSQLDKIESRLSMELASAQTEQLERNHKSFSGPKYADGLSQEGANLAAVEPEETVQELLPSPPVTCPNRDDRSTTPVIAIRTPSSPRQMPSPRSPPKIVSQKKMADAIISSNPALKADKPITQNISSRYSRVVNSFGDYSRSPSTPTTSRSFVDFRTGFSGHSGLGMASSGSSEERRERFRPCIRMMSEHRGIGPIGRLSRWGTFAESNHSAPPQHSDLSST